MIFGCQSDRLPTNLGKRPSIWGPTSIPKSTNTVRRCRPMDDYSFSHRIDPVDSAGSTCGWWNFHCHRENELGEIGVTSITVRALRGSPLFGGKELLQNSISTRTKVLPCTIVDSGNGNILVLEMRCGESPARSERHVQRFAQKAHHRTAAGKRGGHVVDESGVKYVTFFQIAQSDEVLALEILDQRVIGRKVARRPL